MLRNVALSAGLTALLVATPAHAHHPSGAGTTGGAGPIITVPDTTLEKGHSSAAVVFVLEINGEWHARQEVAGVRDPNSGGNVVFLSPGLRLSYERWSGFVSVGVPIINDLNGLQAEPDWRVLTGVAVNF